MRKIMNLPPSISSHTINLNFRFTEKLIRITKNSNNFVIIIHMIITKTKTSKTTWSPIIP
ncbi:hypothetical protein MtrunA17_Chr2g0287081 [Medicago truncatula]|uniref:Uncharacterized protein n=1 Tax=Medicago truncatula TaxID=3880 RepID=I3S624_MEDTR|nr:unknown [Medicago truncatula]RHN72384.1 hypothetical protein MtrunA17_Chr2g0287081 [Medicago truncatula]